MAWKIAIVRKKLFIPLALAMSVFLSGLIFTVYRLQWDHIHSETALRIESFHKNFQSQVQSETELINGLLSFIMENKNLQRDWLAGDRDALLRDATPIFTELRSRSLITHFYFITPDKECFLRVHKPESRGDVIDRITMDIAAHLGRSAHGIEMGPFGTVALRVVHPWVIDGKVAGYIELGEDVEQITARISQIMNIELLSVVAKKYLDKGKWEQGLRMSGRTGDWDRYKDFVVVSSDSKKVYPGLDKVLAESKKSDDQFVLSAGGRTLNGGFDASIDAAGNNIGKFVIFSDVSGEEKSLYGILLRLGAFTLVISGLTLAFFDWYISRIHNKHAEAERDSMRETERAEPAANAPAATEQQKNRS